MSPEEIYNEARAAGCKAWEECTPNPVVFGQAKSLFGNEMVPGTESLCTEGCCGFAWVIVKPARGPFIKYCKENKIGSKHVYPGWYIGARGPWDSQSIDRKEAYAYAFAAVLSENGLNCYVGSRLD